MNAKGLYYPEVNIEFSKTDDYAPTVKIENGIIFVEAVNQTDGRKYWIRADRLMSQAKANAEALDYLMGGIWNIAIGKMAMSKAELKRQFIRHGLISK